MCAAPQPPIPSTPSEHPFRYNAQLAGQIEHRWQHYWEDRRVFSSPNPGEPGFDSKKPKKYVLDMFPYPSGVGLHVGHPLGYIATDIYARYMRMAGHNVLHSMGFDSFGLPAEQFAVQTGTHPRITTERNIATMRAQLRRLGLGHDPRRSVSTTDPEFYKWTQWIFLQIYNSWYDDRAPGGGKARPIAELAKSFERGEIATRDGRPWTALNTDERRAEVDARRLAYVAEVPVNWCPMLGTVLANEEVTADGRSERGNFPVYRRPLKQWMMRITAYAERLLADLDRVDWSDAIKLMQRNWIGRSEGAFVTFELPAIPGKSISVFTTRPDTLFGATYMVLSPEHPLVDELMAYSSDAVTDFAPAHFPGWHDTMGPREACAVYRKFAAAKSDVDRQAQTKDKTGVFTGCYATNPVNGAKIPIFLADYVLTGYGTGAIMAVPAHDERDFEFAQTFDLPIRDVVYPRAIMAMKYFADSAYPSGQPSAGWRDELADFLGLATSAAQQDEPLDVVLTIVQADRRGGKAQTRSAPEPDKPGSIGERRDAVRNVWLEAIDDLGLANYSDLVHRFSSAGYQKARGEAYGGVGTMVNSSGPELSIDGLSNVEAKAAVSSWLEAKNLGRAAVTFKLRDWLFSRQRYWGEPFPIVFDENGVVRDLPESMLPVLLPNLENFQPEATEDPNAPPRPPLGRAREWISVELDLGDGKKTYTRELNTMPNWAGSCWYYLRYLDPQNNGSLCGREVEKYWMQGQTSEQNKGGVDLYVGGVEHAVLHLLYARFWHKVLFDLGHVSTIEPFQKLFNQGYIQAAAYTDERGMYVEASEVEERDNKFFYKGKPVKREFGKMGKSLKNAITPDDICKEFGCDTLRVYEMAMGPLDLSKPWNTRDITGSYKFLQRVWRNLIDEDTGASRVEPIAPSEDTTRLMHKTIIAVRRAMEQLSFNTAITKLIEFNNHLSDLKPSPGTAPGAPIPLECARALILMLSPLAPHMAEELWHRVVLAKSPIATPGASIAHEPFPVADPALAADDQVEVPVQVQGKVRSRVVVAAGADVKTHEAAAMADAKIIELLGGKPPRKVIVVPGRMVNIIPG